MYEAKPSIALKQNSLPTMYDLPSEEVGDSGLPDQYHFWQGELLSETFAPPPYPDTDVLVACDLNLYYDLEHPLWYKRPDWFAVVGVDQFYQKTAPRLSYVMWQEQVKPFVIVELLSPSTQKEDLGLMRGKTGKPPYKWEVYEEILQVPYYVVFDGHSNQLRLFKLINGRYQAETVGHGEYWFADLDLGLKLVFCQYKDLSRLWLRWYDRAGHLILTAAERVQQEQQRVEQEKQRAEQEKQRADVAELEIARLRALLHQSGINRDEVGSHGQ